MNVADYERNLPFIYREVVRSEALLLSGAVPTNARHAILALPQGEDTTFEEVGLLPAICLPFDLSSVSLKEYLDVVRLEFLAKGFTFPVTVVPSSDICSAERLNPFLEYFYVYDFIEQAKTVLIQTRSLRLKESKGLEICESDSSELESGFLKSLTDEIIREGLHPDAVLKRLFVDTGQRHILFIRGLSNGEVVGVASYLKLEHHFRLLYLFCRENQRNRGIGEVMLSSFLKISKAEQALLVSSVLPVGSMCKYYLGKFGFDELFTYSCFSAPFPDFFKEA